MSRTDRRPETAFDPYAEGQGTSDTSSEGEERTAGEAQPASAREAIVRATAALGGDDGAQR